MLKQDYSPTLADLISLDDLPDELDFMGNLAEGILEHFYYRNFRSHSSPRCDRGSCNLDVDLYRTLTLFKVPGTELAVVPNPPDVDGVLAGSSFNVTLSYELEVTLPPKTSPV